MENENNFEKVEFMNSEQDLINAMQAETGSEPQPEPVQEPQQSDYVDPEAAPVQEEVTTESQETDNQSYNDQVQYSDEEVESAVLSYMSERLGQDIQSFDYFSQESNESVVDERLEAISRFVQDTGRSPEDWFRYQQLNPSEMDDATAIRVTTANQYPNLSYEEINMLMNNKYKLDPDQYSEDEIRMSQLQMKMDADASRKSLEQIRNEYAAPEAQQESEPETWINDEWLATMDHNVDDLEGLEFDLGNGKSFTFALNDQAKNNLANSNAYIDEFFDDYVNDQGAWDFDKLNSHMAVIQNIDAIVDAAYKQGMGDGQRGLVNKAANVSNESPSQGQVSQNPNSISEQLRSNGFMGGNTLTFNI